MQKAASTPHLPGCAQLDRADSHIKTLRQLRGGRFGGPSVYAPSPCLCLVPACRLRLINLEVREIPVLSNHKCSNSLSRPPLSAVRGAAGGVISAVQAPGVCASRMRFQSRLQMSAATSGRTTICLKPEEHHGFQPHAATATSPLIAAGPGYCDKGSLVSDATACFNDLPKLATAERFAGVRAFSERLIKAHFLPVPLGEGKHLAVTPRVIEFALELSV